MRMINSEARRMSGRLIISVSYVLLSFTSRSDGILKKFAKISIHHGTNTMHSGHGSEVVTTIIQNDISLRIK
jgi:hypothetical protein